MMNPMSLPNLAVEAPPYVALQREMHDALRAQHPEWILPNGDCPTGELYDARFAELLIQLSRPYQPLDIDATSRGPKGPRGLNQRNTLPSQYEFQYPSRVSTTQDIQ
jgi:hypothetical protein